MDHPLQRTWEQRRLRPFRGCEPCRDKVFVTGSSWGGSASGNDYATVAYNASTGATLWVKRYNGPANGEDEASSVVSPGNGKVYVTGHLTAATGTDYATVAYSAASGAQLWARRYNGPANGIDLASSLVVSPNGSRVFVTGASVGVNSAFDYATVAYGG